MLYPMYVVGVSSFLRMFRVRPHQALKEEGIVVKLEVGRGMTVTFVSHQWCGRSVADPDFRQLRVLQGLLRRAIAGDVRIEMDYYTASSFTKSPTMKRDRMQLLASGYLWYDYFSVPQPAAPLAESSQHADLSADLGKAVASLGAYVDLSEYFVVLAPTIRHEEGHIVDYQSWKKRGWCRFERLARALSPGSDTTMLLVRQEEWVVQVGAHEYLHDAVGKGEFGCEEDRARIAPRATAMLKAKLTSFLRAGRLPAYRFLMSMRRTLCEGLPAEWRDVWPAEVADALPSGADAFTTFMHDFLLSSPTQEVDGSWPLDLASNLGDFEVVQALLLHRACVDCKQKRARPEHLRLKGSRSLHAAVARGHLSVVGLLLRYRADVNGGDSKGRTPLMNLLVGSPAIVAMMLDHRADIAHRNGFGTSALDLASMLDRAGAVRALLGAGHPREANANGFSALHNAAIHGAGQEVAEVLIGAGVRVDGRVLLRGIMKWWTSVFSALHRLGLGGSIAFQAFHIKGMTPLMFARITSNTPVASVLLAHRADPKARNARGLTALDLARAIGALCEEQVVMEDFSPAAVVAGA